MKDQRNELLKRREVKILVTQQGNPGVAAATKQIAEQFKATEEQIAIKAVKSKFGRDTFLLDAHIYDSVADKLKIEPKPKAKKAPAGQ